MVAYEGRLWLIGGSTLRENVATIECWDPLTDTWSMLGAELNKGRRGGTSIIVPLIPPAILPVTIPSTPSSAPPTPKAGSSGSTTVVPMTRSINHTILIAGDDYGGNHSTFEQWSPVNNQWVIVLSSNTKLRRPQDASGLSVLNDRLIGMGHLTRGDESDYEEKARVDTDTPIWQRSVFDLPTEALELKKIDAADDSIPMNEQWMKDASITLPYVIKHATSIVV
jgi:hypothetical protein